MSGPYTIAMIEELIICAEDVILEARGFGLPLNEIRKFDDAIAAARNFQDAIRKKQ